MGKFKGMAAFSAVAVVGLALGLMAFPAVGEAQEGAKWTWSLTKSYTASPWTHEVGYGQQAIGKLGFGLKNLLLGWTDLFTEPAAAHRDGKSVLNGIGMGLVDAVGNELGGALHLVTFPITVLDVPLPEGGVQLMQ